MSLEQLIDRAVEQTTPSGWTIMMMDMVGLFYLAASDLDSWLSVLTHALVAISMAFTVMLKYRKYYPKKNNEKADTDEN